MPAPDFPTSGIIYGLAGVHEAYRTGRGRAVMRARTHFEDIGKGERQAIIIDELPYQVNKRVLLEKIAEMVNEKRLEGISDIRDESDKSGMRAVLELKRGERRGGAQQPLQDDAAAGQLPHEHGGAGRRPAAPALLKDLLEAFIAHRREVVTRRTVYELRQARARGHVLEGLAVALSNVDEVIELIKKAPSPAEEARPDGPRLGFRAGEAWSEPPRRSSGQKPSQEFGLRKKAIRSRKSRRRRSSSCGCSA